MYISEEVNEFDMKCNQMTLLFAYEAARHNYEICLHYSVMAGFVTNMEDCVRFTKLAALKSDWVRVEQQICALNSAALRRKLGHE